MDLKIGIFWVWDLEQQMKICNTLEEFSSAAKEVGSHQQRWSFHATVVVVVAVAASQI